MICSETVSEHTTECGRSPCAVPCALHTCKYAECLVQKVSDSRPAVFQGVWAGCSKEAQVWEQRRRGWVRQTMLLWGRGSGPSTNCGGGTSLHSNTCLEKVMPSGPCLLHHSVSDTHSQRHTHKHRETHTLPPHVYLCRHNMYIMIRRWPESKKAQRHSMWVNSVLRNTCTHTHTCLRAHGHTRTHPSQSDCACPPRPCHALWLLRNTSSCLDTEGWL